MTQFDVVNNSLLPLSRVSQDEFIEIPLNESNGSAATLIENSISLVQQATASISNLFSKAFKGENKPLPEHQAPQNKRVFEQQPASKTESVKECEKLLETEAKKGAEKGFGGRKLRYDVFVNDAFKKK